MHAVQYLLIGNTESVKHCPIALMMTTTHDKGIITEDWRNMGLSEEYTQRLEALNGGPLRYRGDAVPRVARVRKAPVTRGTVALDETVPGVEVLVPGVGLAYWISTPVRDLGEAWAHVSNGFLSSLDGRDAPLTARLARHKVAGVMPQDVLFVDLETTGLSHTPLFLIGTMVWEDGDLVVHQYLARNFEEEAVVTALFLDAAQEKTLLISFNGRSFDVPYVRQRAAVHGLPCALDHPHLDLLHESRRAWRGQVPNCRLQTLEQCVCGHPPREGDIPGAAIPAAYHAFVRTGDSRQLVQIIRHNVLDLVTLAELMARLP
jgi:uncharacterized protein YprB with RNaseH-like and TPR domain